MTDETAAPSGGNDITVIEAPADTGADLSISQAARALASARHRKPEATESPAESAETATAEPELSDEDNTAPLEEAHGEDQELDPAAEPLIERPKSWTEAEDAEWRATPRALQQKIVARELERDTALRRTQNDAAEKLKGLTAKEQQAEQAKEQYEAKLSAQMQSLEDINAERYGDIKSMSDVERIQNEITRLVNEGDFIKAQQYQAYLSGWQVHQTKMATVKADLDRSEGEKAQKHQSEWTKHVQTENALAAEYIPELADKAKGPALTQRAAERLNELGFKPEELNDLASGKQKLSIYDHRIQRLIFSDLKLSDIQKAPKAVAAKPVPPVQRPGTARPQSQSASEKTQALTRQLETSGSIKDAVALRALQSQRRAS